MLRVVMLCEGNGGMMAKCLLEFITMKDIVSVGVISAISVRRRRVG